MEALGQTANKDITEEQKLFSHIYSELRFLSEGSKKRRTIISVPLKGRVFFFYYFYSQSEMCLVLEVSLQKCIMEVSQITSALFLGHHQEI